MKTQNAKLSNAFVLAVALVTLCPALQAEEYVTNRLTASARVGFNMSVRFRGTVTGLPANINTRTTPHGDAYNYDDGYVLTDISGNYGGQTWYWGYDNSASQISGNNILLSQATANPNFTSPDADSDPSIGFEVAYHHMLGAHGKMSYGFELAGNYQNISATDRSTFTTGATRNTYAFAFTPGTTAPAATPGNPYQGSYEGPGFFISDTPVPFSTAAVPGGYTISGERKFDADMFGLRVGPYLDVPLSENLHLLGSAGFAAAWMTTDASWNDTFTLGPSSVASVGRGSDDAFLVGYYAALNLSWDFREDWSAVVGAQYQHLDSYHHDFGGRTVEANLQNPLFITFGLSYRF